MVVTISEVKNFGAKAVLEEYKGKEGFIHIAEVASGWVKHIRDHLREGQKTVCKVLNVDTSRGYVDLSLKRVNAHQKREKVSEWKNAQKAEKLLEIVASNLGKTVEQCETEFVGDLLAQYGTLYRAFEDAAADEEWIPEVQEPWKDAFIKIARENITIPYVKIGGYIEAYSIASDGVDRVRQILSLGNQEGFKIQYSGAPRYRLQLTDKDYKSAEEKLKKTIDEMSAASRKSGVSFEFSRIQNK